MPNFSFLLPSGDGKARVRDEKQTTVFKRALNVEYHLKLKTSRTILSEINKRYPCMPFPLRKLLEDGSTSRLGLVECLQHGLLQSYPVLWEKDGALVAQVKGTVLLLPNGSDRITCSRTQNVHSEIQVSVRSLMFRNIRRFTVHIPCLTPLRRQALPGSFMIILLLFCFDCCLGYPVPFYSTVYCIPDREKKNSVVVAWVNSITLLQIHAYVQQVCTKQKGQEEFGGISHHLKKDLY